mmetsp:Transcript_1940/g.3394  ORF Transcript_1940/g.3394 Transcript_1940/m.3394 type:complete len:216 (+) Transcript_1940:555-1202(+)
MKHPLSPSFTCASTIASTKSALRSLMLPGRGSVKGVSKPYTGPMPSFANSFARMRKFDVRPKAPGQMKTGRCSSSRRFPSSSSSSARTLSGVCSSGAVHVQLWIWMARASTLHSGMFFSIRAWPGVRLSMPISVITWMEFSCSGFLGSMLREPADTDSTAATNAATIELQCGSICVDSLPVSAFRIAVTCPAALERSSFPLARRGHVKPGGKRTR